MRAIDLHSHSLKSDGTFSPSELMAYAAKKNLKAIALTDHDTTAGLNEAANFPPSSGFMKKIMIFMWLVCSSIIIWSAFSRISGILLNPVSPEITRCVKS